ncbi:MAG: cell division protein FtsZ [bacterium]|nr:cell division protein FtsZ [bacterium]
MKDSALTRKDKAGNMRFQFAPICGGVSQYTPTLKIKVIGVGGGGCNFVNTMVEAGIDGVDFIATNTDIQALSTSRAPYRVQIGVNLTGGLGAGGDPNIGRKAIEENRAEIIEMLKGANLVFITCGMGGGTGTGASPIIAQLVKELGAFAISVVTKPFESEGIHRMNQAMEGICELKKYTDVVIVIPNQKLFSMVRMDTPFLDAFRVVDQVLAQIIRGISGIITRPGLVNVDFADIRAVMSEPGDIIVGIGRAKGKDRAINAVNQAINSPFIDETGIMGTKGILVNIIGGKDLTICEVNDILSTIQEKSNSTANIVFGACFDNNIQEDIEITLIATGIKLERKVEENFKVPAFKRKMKSLGGHLNSINRNNLDRSSLHHHQNGLKLQEFNLFKSKKTCFVE